MLKFHVFFQFNCLGQQIINVTEVGLLWRYGCKLYSMVIYYIIFQKLLALYTIVQHILMDSGNVLFTYHAKLTVLSCCRRCCVHNRSPRLYCRWCIVCQTGSAAAPQQQWQEEPPRWFSVQWRTPQRQHVSHLAPCCLSSLRAKIFTRPQPVFYTSNCL